eukprot:gene18966-22703_t
MFIVNTYQVDTLQRSRLVGIRIKPIGFTNTFLEGGKKGKHIDTNSDISPSALSTLTSTISCEVCQLGALLLDGFLESNTSVEVVIEEFIVFCNKLHLHQIEPIICEGLMNTYVPVIFDVMVESALDPSVLCTEFRFCSMSESVKFEQYEEYNQMGMMITSNLQTTKTKGSHLPVLKNEKPMMATPFTGVGYFLQLTDIHFDPFYVVGSEPDCGLPLCCRDGNGTAGYFGDYACDLPIHTIKAILEEIKVLNETYPISFIIYTGDNQPHDIWNQSVAKQIYATEEVSTLLINAFPSTPLFPSVGNHESWPSEEFILPSKQWLLDTLNDVWAPFLGKDQLETVKKAGYYTSLLQKGLRVVSLNTYDGDLYNFYNLLRKSNMDIKNNQTEWFINVMEQAESNDESVIIVGHIPCTLKSQTNDLWCLIYLTIVERFSPMIVAQIYGHTHLDQLIVYADAATNSKPTGMSYVTPSITSHLNHEPSFRLF